MLEPYDGKLSRTVLRGEWGGNAPDLPGHVFIVTEKYTQFKVKLLVI